MMIIHDASWESVVITLSILQAPSAMIRTSCTIVESETHQVDFGLSGRETKTHVQRAHVCETHRVNIYKTPGISPNGTQRTTAGSQGMVYFKDIEQERA